MFSAGQVVGNYQILSKLGTGGMGAVYLAEHPLIGKKVALKVIHRELSGNREVVQRFFQEARAVNTIGHEHIVEIHDFGQTPEGDHFYIMEFLDGLTLAQAISRERRLDVRRALHISAQIASGLAAAHACGVIHRDLKPDNVMLLQRGLGGGDFVKILDFGLAKMFASGNAPLTAMGVVLGTPQYMSPEACESKRDVDHRTDIYAVGILLFQMLTGALPFDGASMGEVLVKQVTQLPPAPRGLNPEIPPSVEQIILRCLAKKPDGRFATMEQLRDALLAPDQYLASSPPMAAARSVLPNEAQSAKTMMAMAPPRARTAEPMPRAGTDGGALGVANTMALGLATTGSVPVPAPPRPPTGGGQLHGGPDRPPPGPGQAQARTMIAGQAPMLAMPAMPMGQGQSAAGPGPQGHEAAVGAQARTMMAPGLGSPGLPPMPGSPALPPGAPPPGPPGPPMNLENRTMIIATPVGYISAPPRRRWRLITAVAALSLLLGAALLVLTRSGGDKSLATVDAGDGEGAAKASDAASAAAPDAPADPPRDGGLQGGLPDEPDARPDAGVAAPVSLPDAAASAAPDAAASATAEGGSEVIIETVPEGAAIWIAGAERGTAPLTLRFDASTKKLTIEARLAGYATKKQTVSVEGKTSVQFNLEKTRERDKDRDKERDKGRKGGAKTAPKNPPNDLMRP